MHQPLTISNDWGLKSCFIVHFTLYISCSPLPLQTWCHDSVSSDTLQSKSTRAQSTSQDSGHLDSTIVSNKAAAWLPNSSTSVLIYPLKYRPGHHTALIVTIYRLPNKLWIIPLLSLNSFIVPKTKVHEDISSSYTEQMSGLTAFSLDVAHLLK